MPKRPEWIIESWNNGAPYWLESYDRDTVSWSPDIMDAKRMTHGEAVVVLATAVRGVPDAAMCKLSEVKRFGSRA